ncbi:VID27 cytoplasmic protein-domain-containing protein [Globomyces pollinis-pini]|nr:VID27 cytoplasmic protein-domain-containing protein [Globomyces pollinis-pini]
MFLLKSIGNIVFGNNDGSLVQLPSGKLFYLDPNATQTRHQVFRDASMSIRKTDSPFNYELLVTRVFEEGEQELEAESENQEEDLLHDFEASFLIDQCLLFTVEGSKFIWADLEDETRTCGWEYVVDVSSNQTSIDLFFETMMSCMYERAFKKSAQDALELSIKSFTNQVQLEAKEASIGVWQPKSKTDKVAATNPPSSTTLKTPVKPAENTLKTTPVKSSPQAHKIRLPEAEIPDGSVLFTIDSSLWMFETGVGSFVPSLPKVTTKIYQTGRYEFSLVVFNDDAPVLSQVIEQRMNPFFDVHSLSFIWVWCDPVTSMPSISWSLKFDENDSVLFEKFNHFFCQCTYETLHKDEYAKMKESDQEYLEQLFKDMEIDEDLVTDEDAESDENVEDDETVQPTSLRVTSNSDDEDDEMVADRSQTSNSLLAVGKDRSFVVRGNRIGVFRHTNDDQLEFANTINNVGTTDGQYFSPRKLMLHKDDTSLLMLKPGDDKKVYKMDLDYGKVVDEWNLGDYVRIDDLAPITKHAQRTNNEELVGMNDRAIYRIDGRLDSKNKLASNTTTQYTSKVELSSVTTTKEGFVAVGSSKGDIRLFDRLGLQRAKTQLAGLGDKIIGLDTSDNGKYILATCETYLMVIDTEMKGETKNAFQKSIKTQPRRLQLKPEHVAWMGQRISFTPARFNTSSETSMEKTIVTSTGPYVITWNFRKVKQGKYHDYSIKQYSETVVADNFKYGADRSIIVALPSNVEMVSKNNLQTPTKMLKSRNSIVNSPY